MPATPHVMISYARADARDFAGQLRDVRVHHIDDYNFTLDISGSAV